MLDNEEENKRSSHIYNNKRFDIGFYFFGFLFYFPFFLFFFLFGLGRRMKSRKAESTVCFPLLRVRKTFCFV